MGGGVHQPPHLGLADDLAEHAYAAGRAAAGAQVGAGVEQRQLIVGIMQGSGRRGARVDRLAELCHGDLVWELVAAAGVHRAHDADLRLDGLDQLERQAMLGAVVGNLEDVGVERVTSAGESQRLGDGGGIGPELREVDEHL